MQAVCFSAGAAFGATIIGWLEIPWQPWALSMVALATLQLGIRFVEERQRR